MNLTLTRTQTQTQTQTQTNKQTRTCTHMFLCSEETRFLSPRALEKLREADERELNEKMQKKREALLSPRPKSMRDILRFAHFSSFSFAVHICS